MILRLLPNTHWLARQESTPTPTPTSLVLYRDGRAVRVIAQEELQRRREAIEARRNGGPGGTVA